MYASVSDAATTEEQRDRAEQLLSQTAKVSTREHFYRTEMRQMQDELLSEKEEVNKALLTKPLNDRLRQLVDPAIYEMQANL